VLSRPLSVHILTLWTRTGYGYGYGYSALQSRRSWPATVIASASAACRFGTWEGDAALAAHALPAERSWLVRRFVGACGPLRRLLVRRIFGYDADMARCSRWKPLWQCDVFRKLIESLNGFKGQTVKELVQGTGGVCAVPAELHRAATPASPPQNNKHQVTLRPTGRLVNAIDVLTSGVTRKID
jgi:hypothetical protein